MARSVKTNALVPGQIMIMDGYVHFSRITRRLDGEDLERDMQIRRQKGLVEIKEPYASLNLKDVTPLYTNDASVDTYMRESIFQGAVANQYTAISKSRKNANGEYMFPLPKCYQIQEDGSFQEFIPRAEFAQDLHVRVVLRVYAGTPNNGISFDAVLVLEPVKYYESSNIAKNLEQLGLVFKPLSEKERAEQLAVANANLAPQNKQSATPVAEPARTIQVNGNAFTSVPNNMANPYNNQPVQPDFGNINNQQINPNANQNVNPNMNQGVNPNMNNQQAAFPQFNPNTPVGNIKPAMPGIMPVIKQ